MSVNSEKPLYNGATGRERGGETSNEIGDTGRKRRHVVWELFPNFPIVGRIPMGPRTP